MSARRDKQQRVLLTLESGVSNRALRRVVKRINEGQVDVSDLDLNNREIERALQGTYGALLTEITLDTSKGPFRWELAEPSAILQAYLQTPSLTPYVRDMLSRCGTDPRNPVRLIFYCDELVPGNALKLNNKRKTNAYYVTPLQLAPELRAHREVWIPLGFLRSCVAKSIHWSEVAAKLFERAFVGPRSIKDAGIVLKLGSDQPRLVFFEFHGMIGDSPALQGVWGSLGCNGNFPCIECVNVISKASELTAHDVTGGLVDTSCSDRSQLVRATNEDVWGKFDELAAIRATTRIGRFGLLQTAAGLRYLPHGVLANPSLRPYVKPVDGNMHDPMHIYVSNGVMNFELHALFTYAGFSDCYSAMRLLTEAAWHLPKLRRNISIKRPFDEAHEKASHNEQKCFKCQASELLTVVPLVRYYMDMAIAPRHPIQAASFRAAHDSLYLAMESKSRGNVSPERMNVAAAHHLECLKAAYGTEPIKPKHHMALHIGDVIKKMVVAEWIALHVSERASLSRWQLTTSITLIDTNVLR